MTNDHQMEILQTGLNGVVYAQIAGDPVAEIRAENRLLDYCFDAGMDHDEPNHVDWAAIKLGEWMGGL